MTRAGRPPGPTPDTRTTVLKTALDLLLAEGPAALSAQRVHQASGVSRSTVYRHWPTPKDLLRDLVEVAQEPALPLTDDLAENLHAAVDILCDRIREKPVAQFLRALASLAQPAATSGAPDEAQLRYIAGLNAPFRRAFESAGIDARIMHDIIPAVVSPILIDAMVLGRDPEGSRARAHRQIDHQLRLLDR